MEKLNALEVEIELKGFNEVKTCELVRELERREGIKKIWVEPEDTFELLVTSPTLVLVITD